MLEQTVRELRDREHEHQVEEQLDVGDAMVLVSVPYPKVICSCREHRRHQSLVDTASINVGYLIASGLTGEPTAPVIGIAGATNRNS